MSPLSIEQEEKALEALLEETIRALSQAQDAAAVEAVRVKVLGRQGALTARFSVLRDPALAPEHKIELGKRLNAVKGKIEEAIAQCQQAASRSERRRTPAMDITLPGISPEVGRIHPIPQTVRQILEIFRALGFAAVQGPEIETERNNFEALNIPAEHPSRESFDTFYLKQRTANSEQRTRFLLRSHTSPVQVRFMETHPPPFRIVVPGRVFRPDAVDASHCFQFHQVEGLAVAPGLTFGDLKGTLSAWAQEMFGSRAVLRFRPHFFPFTEPSAEVDLSCLLCLPAKGWSGQAGAGKGCRVCGQKGWLEILGCGMVHPEVFRAVGYPVGTVGFAFGMGVERIAMLLYGIDDIRLFFENDLRFLTQFR